MLIIGTIVVLVVGLLLISKTVGQNKNVTESQSAEKAVNNLAINLNQRTTLNQQNLSKKNTSKLEAIRKKINKDQFIGAYVGLSDKQVKYSGFYGYANANTKNTFRWDSQFLAGKYQNILNALMVARLIDNNKLSLSTNLTTVLKSSSFESVSVKELVTSKRKFYITKKALSNQFKINLKDIKQTKISNDYVSANERITELLIAKIERSSYETAINRLLVGPLSLNETKVVGSSSAFANNVLSYDYVKQNSTVVQTKVINLNSLVNSKAYVRISLRDLVITLSSVENNTLLGVKGKKAIQVLIDPYVTSGGLIKLNTSEYQQKLSILANIKSNKIAIVATNFPNKKLDFKKLNLELYKLL